MPTKQKLCPGCQLPAAKKRHWWGRVGHQCLGPQPEGVQAEWTASPMLDSSRPAMNTRLSRRNHIQDAVREHNFVSTMSDDDEHNTEADPPVISPLLHERQRLEEENEQLQLELLRQKNAKLRLELQQVDQEPIHHRQPQERLLEPLADFHIGHTIDPALAQRTPQPRQHTGKEPLRIIDFISELDNVADDGVKRDPRTLDSVSISEWNVANIRIMYTLLQANELAHEASNGGEGGTLDAYLAYTVKIMEYAGQFPWKSVLKYDQAFRHKQAVGLLSWEDDNQHLVTVHLVSPLHQQRANTRQEGKRPTGKPICRMFNQPGGCSWSGPGGCSYMHRCSVPGCAQQHPAHMHDNNVHVGTQNSQPQSYNNATRE